MLPSNKARFMSVFVILTMLFSFASVSPAAAQDEAPPNLPGWTQGTGTHFELLDSAYLPVTLDSSATVTLILSSVPEIVDLTIVPDAAGSAEFTLGGFAANTLYYHYVDEGLNPVTFTTDAAGSFTYIQDLSEGHHVWFRTQPSTKYLYDNPTGGDCATIGSWSSGTKTCTLTQNVNETISIQNSGITLDGAGKQLSTPGTYAVYSYGFSNVTIKNLRIVSSATGIRIERGSYNTVKDNTISGGTGWAIIGPYDNSTNGTVSGNTISNNSLGILAGYYFSNNNTISDNTVSNSGYGIYTGYFSSNNTVRGNTLSNNSALGIYFIGYASNNNQIYNNNLVSNNTQIRWDNFGASGNVFNLAAPVGGNYFSNFNMPAQGCNNANSDTFCDTPYGFPGGQDNLPWTTQNGWVAPADTTPPVITYTLTPSTPDGANGWYKTNVALVWSVTDPESTVTKTGCVDQNITADQLATPYACSATSAGGSSGPVSVTIQRDATLPTDVSGAATRLPDHNGWYNAPVDVTFSGQDGTSGIASCTSAAFSGPDNAAASAAGSCTDNAGNAANGSFALMYDASAPSASLSVTAGTAGANGWYISDVTVSTSGSDSVSGIESCTPDQFQTAETAGASFDGSCTNGAGLTMNATPLTIKLDKTAPTVSLIGGPADGASYYFGSVPAAPTCSASDALSGLDGSCTVSDYSALVGSQTVTATANDMASNQNSASATYTVLAWTTNGFFQPVDMGGVWNTVKGGSTVPLKFEVFAGSTELTDTSIVNQPLKATQTLCSGGSIDDIELTATGATSLRYDTTDGQFIYNWKTPKKPGYCYVVTITMADGSTISANFTLK